MDCILFESLSLFFFLLYVFLGASCSLPGSSSLLVRDNS